MQRAMTEPTSPSAAAPKSAPAAADATPLEWVRGEIRGSLAEAAQQVRAFLVAKTDPAPLRAARDHLHQVNGALHMLDLRGVTQVVEAAERLVALWESNPRECLPSAVRSLEATFAAVRNYLDGLIRGRDEPPIRLYPYYREILVLLGAPRIHPADLLFPDLGRNPPTEQINVRPLSTDELRVRRVRYEEGLLRFLRDPENTLARSQMRDAVADLEGMPQRRSSRTFWWIVRGLFDALEVSGLSADEDCKRLFARINQQILRQLEGNFAIADRLMTDAIFHAARADRRVARVGEIRALFDLDTLVPNDFERATLTTIDTEALHELKSAIGQCKALWGQTGPAQPGNAGAARAGSAAALRSEPEPADPFGRAAQAAHRLGADAAANLIECMQNAAPHQASLGAAAREAVAMEVATALLLLELGVDTYPHSDPQFERRAAAMIGRIERAAQGLPLEPAEPWLTELAQSAQERASLETVIAEMRAMLREAELRLDTFFRDPAQRDPLADLDASFEQLAGVFGVLGHEDAVAALHDIAAVVRRFRDPAVDADRQEFARIAQNLGAIGFFVDMLVQDPAAPRAMFRFDPQTGTLHADIATARETPAAQIEEEEGNGLAAVAEAPTGAGAPGAVRGAVPDATDVGPGAAGHDAEGEEQSSAEWLAAGREIPVHVPSAPLPEDAAAVDQELFEIFLAEADEQLQAIGEQIERLRGDPGDRDALTMARRAFHTLKGSSRMVGLHDFGEFAWALEQCFNVVLSQEQPATPGLIDLAAASAARMGAWIAALRRDPQAQVDDGSAPGSASLSSWIAAADTVRGGGPFTSPEAARPPLVAPADDTLRIGPVAVSRGLYAIFLQESDECIRALEDGIARWRAHSAVSDGSTAADEPTDFEALVRRAHTLAGIAGTVGVEPVCALAEPIDAVLQWVFARATTGVAPFRPTDAQFETLSGGIAQMKAMLHQFAGGVLPDPDPATAAALQTLLAIVREMPAPSQPESAPAAVSAAPAAAEPRPEPASALPAEAAPEVPAAAPEPTTPPTLDEIDADLAPIFLAEAQDLFPAISADLRRLEESAGSLGDGGPAETARELMRALHTLKGSARMAGAMRLGEVVHAMEARIESAIGTGEAPGALADDLHGRFDHAAALFEALQHAPAPDTAATAAAAADTGLADVAGVAAPALNAGAGAPAGAPAGTTVGATAAIAPKEDKAPAAHLRVRADILDRLVDHAGEISITRTKLETELGQLRGGLGDLADNILRLRTQLREIEVQADAQIQAQANETRHAENFDPLEFDRYSRLQELTRQLAESVEDVALVQSGMSRALQLADNDISAQSRLTRDLQQNLLHMRMVPFANVADRLFRVARQSARELGKRVRLDLEGENTEVDRSVLEHMAGPFEHLVRNAIVHGLELPAARTAAGKPDTGELRVSVHQESNEVVVVFADDGRGLDWERIRARGESSGRIPAGRIPDERELIELIFAPGFSTADEVTELAGRGVGMDAVRAQVAGLGGRIAVSSEAGRGTRFTLYLPMSLSVMQVVLARIGDQRFAIPAAMVEQDQHVAAEELLPAIQRGAIAFEGIGEVVLRPLAQLVGRDPTPRDTDTHALALLRLGDDRLAISADEFSAPREVVVKNVGPQVARLAGVLGATVLGDGQVVLICNPVQLIARAPEPPEVVADFDLGSMAPESGLERVPEDGAGDESPAPLRTARTHTAHILIVDDSLTVRRVTQRLLERNGYHTILAKDGIDALRTIETQRPDCILADIEMPRMDGYDLTRAIRANAATHDIPVIMITSRTAEKHRRMAFELGADEYLGKPYQEEELLRLIRMHVGAKARA